jgi:uncharacterized protein YjiS (DUF1127 family)
MLHCTKTARLCAERTKPTTAGLHRTSKMSQRLAKEEMALLMPNTLSHYFKDDPEQLPVMTDDTGVFARLGGALRWLAELPRRRRVMDELSSLSEHELADIGLSRGDVANVFDPNFALRHNRDKLNSRIQNGAIIRA